VKLIDGLYVKMILNAAGAHPEFALGEGELALRLYVIYPYV
jgi:hypothetical protein